MDRLEMNLLIVWFQFLDTSFSPRQNLKVFESMAADGHRVTCVFPVAKNIRIGSVERLDIHQVRVSAQSPLLAYLQFGLLSIAYLVNSYKFDAVVLTSNMIPWAVPLIVCQRMLRNKVTFAFREASRPVEIRTTHRYYEVLLRIAALRLGHLCDVAFAISPTHAKELMSKYHLPRVYVWPPSVDEFTFDLKRHARTRSSVRKEMSLSHAFVFMYHGVLSHERGLYELFQAMKLVCKKVPEGKLLMLGEGNAQLRLRAIVQEYNLEANVIFHPSVPYSVVPRFISAADAGVIPLPIQPQWTDQPPIKLLEFLAMEKPVVLTETEANRWITRGIKGVYFCSDRPDEIAEAMIDCRLTHSRSGPRRRILSRFSSTNRARDVIAQLKL